jgi:hypothetical protein
LQARKFARETAQEQNDINEENLHLAKGQMKERLSVKWTEDAVYDVLRNKVQNHWKVLAARERKKQQALLQEDRQDQGEPPLVLASQDAYRGAPRGRQGTDADRSAVEQGAIEGRHGVGEDGVEHTPPRASKSPRDAAASEVPNRRLFNTDTVSPDLKKSKGGGGEEVGAEKLLGLGHGAGLLCLP